MKNLEDLAKFPSENPNPVLRMTKEKVIYTNKAGEELFNINEGSDVPAVLKEKIIKSLNTNEVITTEIAISSQIFSLDIIPISEEGYVNVYGKDITDKKEADIFILESEKKLKDLIEALPIGISMSTIEGEVIEINSHIFKIFGYDSKKEFLKVPAKNHYYNPADRDLFIKMLERGFVKNFELKFQRKDGTIFWGSLTSIIEEIGDQTIYINTFQDITGRKRVEEEVADLAKFPEENPNPILRVSKEFVLYTNQAGQYLFNIKIGNRIPILLQDVIHKTFEKNMTQNLDIALNHHFYSLFVTPIKGTSYANIYGLDITERKNAELEIINLAKFPSENPFPVLRASKENILYSNKAGEDLFKIKEGSRLPHELIEWIYKAIDLGTPQLIEVDFGDKTFSFNVLAIKDEGYVNIYGRDITERRCAEIELQKSESTYREAYNRAEFYKDIFTHDINNILQNISNGIQLNEMYLNKPDKLKVVKRNIDIIKRQVKRGANLVSNVRKLSKISESENLLFIVNPNEVLTKTINYIKNSFNDKNLKIEVQISEGNYKILANELLEDVFENILTNSINYNDSEFINIEIKVTKELRQGINYIKFQFSDNGIGVTDERKDQIFVRGYSEETSVHGMGLGLSLVKKIIESYNGEIWMEDKVKGDYTKGNSCLILIPEVVNNG